MSLVDLFAAPPSNAHGGRCSVAAILEKLPADEAAALRAALDDKDWPHSAIERILTNRGHKPGACQVGRHRRGQCSCETT